MRSFVLSLIILIYAMPSYAQVVIANGTKFGTSNNPVILIQTTGDVKNNSTFTFSGTDIHLLLTGGTQSINGSWNLSSLYLSGEGIKDFDNELIVNSSIHFDRGILFPQSSDAKIVFKGEADSIVWTRANSLSYVDGIFYQEGKGRRIFPVGHRSESNELYAPLIFNDVETVERIGVEVVNENPGFTNREDGIFPEPSRYWVIHSENINAINSTVELSTEFSENTSGNAFSVIQADALNEIAESLGLRETPYENMARSDKVVRKPIISIARVEEVAVVIRNLITPFSKIAESTRLHIEQIDAFVDNKVTLLDRWGVVMKVWHKYDRENPDFDFTTLTPGNYICMVELTDRAGNVIKKSQMITILKTR